MHVMQLSDINVDRLSDRELCRWATELWKRFAARANGIPSLVIPGPDGRPMGYVIPASGAPRIPDADAEFIAETMRRIDNPPDRFLTVDEFLAALDDKSSGAIPA
jgi:hypothetical protein